MLLRQMRRLSPGLCQFQQQRNAVVVRRALKLPLLPESATQEEINKSIFTWDFKYMRYTIVEETDTEPGNIKIILLKSSEEFGRRGQILTLNAQIARQELLLPGFATYASPENLVKYQKIVIPEDSVQHSSESASKSVLELSRLVIPLVLNRITEWTIEPWHVRIALQHAGIIVQDDCIELPSNQLLGPNEEYENKEFATCLTINNFEKVQVRCVLFHWAADDLQLIPPHGWEHRFYKAIIPEQEELLKMLPRNKLTETDVAGLLDGQDILEQYTKWKTERDKKLFEA